MFLTYLDDSGSDRKSPVVLVGAVLIKDSIILEMETIGGLVIERFIPDDKKDDFVEFHAGELFHGKGIFEGIDEPSRHGAIAALLQQVARFKIPCIYSAVKKSVFVNGVLGSASPFDVAFRMCSLGVQRYLTTNNEHETALFLFDDTTDGVLKRQLQSSFRELRPRIKPPYWEGPHRLFNIHDAMYFGSSRDSIGIQIADLCNYFILRHLKGEKDELYDIFKEYVVCSSIEPDWTTYRHLFVEHR